MPGCSDQPGNALADKIMHSLSDVRLFEERRSITFGGDQLVELFDLVAELDREGVGLELTSVANSFHAHFPCNACRPNRPSGLLNRSVQVPGWVLSGMLSISKMTAAGAGAGPTLDAPRHSALTPHSISKVNVGIFQTPMFEGSLVKAAPTPPACPIPPPGHPRPRVRIDTLRQTSGRSIQSASRVRAGTRSNDLRAWTPFPVTASDKDTGRSNKPNAGHIILEVNSWPCVTGGPSGRDDLLKSRRDLLRGPVDHAFTCGTSGSPPRDEEITSSRSRWRRATTRV